jgi:hypothetical protein
VLGGIGILRRTRSDQGIRIAPNFTHDVGGLEADTDCLLKSPVDRDMVADTDYLKQRGSVCFEMYICRPLQVTKSIV